ncbi:PAS domain S-box-containing protein/diguanylate cyclase (GGDEF) domain-containing protein [Marinobacter sp. LV10R510-11A]|uniref:bifunctional diguanylate cyclase/phosphodiesterase n=1 Tax=Marinobacter sp. LV10R510-11A TaxID=1415568 RepID=UPI000BB6D3B7|nr:EAL domain-containing protein [Marinobacter sp. LV10R510-11A]SOB78313.1 PAS domain S-box-containing protein/diguanylate cyclase (GGDEF) domain-containing protein [Marinobacter sp. LV10R510-11A]
MSDIEFSLLEAQQKIHELIAQQHPLEQTLDAIASWVSSMMPGALVSIMRFHSDTNSLSLIPTSRFSDDFFRAMQGIPVSETTGTCAAAACTKQLVITNSIQKDPHWDGYHEIAEAEGVHACWSMPILTPSGELLGTFATYYHTPATPTAEAQRDLIRGASLASLAILRQRDADDLLVLSQWHQTLFDNHPDGVYTLDLKGYFQSCNAAVSRLTGYTADLAHGQHFNVFVEPDYRALTEAAFEKARSGEAITYETMGRHASGHTYFLEVTNFPVTIQGEIVGVYGSCRDITNRKDQDAELRLLKRGIEASPNGILMADARSPDMPVVYANPAFAEITGYSHNDLIGRNCRFLQGEDTAPEAIEAIRHGLRHQTEVNVELINYRKDGTPFWNHLRISPVSDNDSTCTHFIGIQQDITHQKEQEAQIAHQATHDRLTGFPNEASFKEKLRVALTTGGGRESLVAMCLGLDGFKSINRELGHLVGDQILMTIGRRLTDLVGPEATVARLDGDEFGLLIPDYTHWNEVIELAERILVNLAQPIGVDGRMIHISVSIGIACNSTPADTPHELLQFAGLALEQAKRQGRNTWQRYSSHKTERSQNSVNLRHDLHAALNESQFEIYYQPLVDAVTGRMRSVEALVRWHHPTRGMVAPGEFIPLAEQTGQIIPLGLWILRQACTEMAGFNAHRERALRVAVNISSLQFVRDGFLDDVRQVLKETGIPPQLLEFEVTESVFLDGTKPVIELMETLKTLGVRVALDDFGTGYSSLSYLRDLPTHKVKLDRSFVEKTTTDRSIAAIVQGVITMAHHMDLIVVAEGIETREQQEDLARRGCDILQGYLFARPMPLAELKKLPDLLPVNPAP